VASSHRRPFTQSQVPEFARALRLARARWRMIAMQLFLNFPLAFPLKGQR
jgi:hypothetical protein